ncbi:MAG TPA: tyrosine-type recombinase/integrase, partial [Tepidisphaeraceae bacterium]|nr:tyrosine-type recombinase/integrase [Tepidisphaeraceae bacterium]
MPVKSPRVPSYCIHTARNQAYVRLNGEMIYLGAPHSPESREKYDRLIAEWMQAGRVYVKPEDKQGVSVNEVLLAYRRHAGTIYTNPDGTPSPEVERVNRALRPVTELYGTTPACQFGPKALVAVQNKIADTGVKRGTVNHRVNVIRRAFKWAAKEELIPASVYHGLQTVDGLRRGRTKAPESVPVKPVPDHIVTAVLKHLPPTLRAMVQLHDLTGMRSGEVIRMRGVDIEMPGDGKPWQYRPHKHKTGHHGHQRVVPLGPKAQEVLRPFLTTDVQAYIFSPARAREERNAARREKRKTKVQPSQMNRRKARPKRPVGTRYTTASYRRALDYATKFAVKHGDLPEGTRWHPHQLRHNAATRIRKLFGLDAV